MIVAGVKHACATCIRGHRSSACTHADRPLFEIRRKGRPVSQCPHCRDLRKIKSCHTKCECGETPAEGAAAQNATGGAAGRCECHAGQPCSCAGPVSVFQYVPMSGTRESAPETSESTSTGQVATPNEKAVGNGAVPHLNGGLLHTFDTFSVKTQNSMPYPSPHLGRRASLVVTAEAQTPATAASPGQSFAGILMQPPVEMHQEAGQQMQEQQKAQQATASTTASTQATRRNSRATLARKRSAPYPAAEAYPSTRSIGINTDMSLADVSAAPSGDTLWGPFLAGLTAAQKSSLMDALLLGSMSAPPVVEKEASSCCSRKDGQVQTDSETGTASRPPDTLSDTTMRIPSFSTFYGGAIKHALASGEYTTPPPDALAIDHFTEEPELLNPSFWQSLFDVPGCALPGVACQCGDGCSCAGCQTHRDNGALVATADLERMDFEHDKPARVHPPGCCDTRGLHEQLAKAQQGG